MSWRSVYVLGQYGKWMISPNASSYSMCQLACVKIFAKYIGTKLSKRAVTHPGPFYIVDSSGITISSVPIEFGTRQYHSISHRTQVET